MGRTPQFLSSGSLVFKAGLFSDWYDERLIPYKHYLPVKLDYSDLQVKSYMVCVGFAQGLH